MNKTLGVRELIHLLDQQRDDVEIGARTLANTGNLTIHRDGEQIGYIDLATREVVFFDADGE